MKAALAMAALLLAMSLAGCGGKATPATGGTTSQPPLEAGKGAIAGLVIDDVYRPVPNALVLIEKAGLTATSDGEGQFTFTGLDPGAYVLKVQSDGHAAGPKNVDVVAGQYADAEIQADRLFNTGSRIVTMQYSIFTSCASSTPVIAVTYSCLLDPDSYRSGLSGLNFSTERNVTYLVVEVKLNQADNYDLVVRHDDNTSSGGEVYGDARISNGVYGKVVLKLGENYMNATEPTNAKWKNDQALAAQLFYLGTGGDQVQQGACTAPDQTIPGTPATSPRHTCRSYFGVGQKFAIEGTIILSLFLGQPSVDINSYSTLKP